MLLRILTRLSNQHIGGNLDDGHHVGLFPVVLVGRSARPKRPQQIYRKSSRQCRRDGGHEGQQRRTRNLSSSAKASPHELEKSGEKLSLAVERARQGLW